MPEAIVLSAVDGIDRVFDPINRATTSRSAGPAVMLVIIAVVGAVFFAVDQSLVRARLEADLGTVQQMAEQKAISVQTGGWTRRLAFPALGLLGLGLVVLPCRKPWRIADPIALLLLLYVAVCGVSVLWSDHPLLATKRAAILGFCLLGALGISRQLSARDVCRLTLIVAALYVLLGGAAEIALGTFRPWTSGYRFAGTVHPNVQGTYCACLCLAAGSLLGGPRQRTWLFAGLLLVGGLLLLLTKSRASLAALAGALIVVWAWRSSPVHKTLAALAAATAVLGAALAMSLAGIHVENRLAQGALLGRQEAIATLTGRIPLWQEIWDAAQDRLLLGYGYGSFWSPEQIEDVSDAVGWGMATAHSAYLETILSVGLLGGALLLVALLLGIRRAATRCRDSCEGSYGFFLAVLVFAALHGLLESTFVLPMFPAFLAACALVHLGCCPATFLEPESAFANREKGPLSHCVSAKDDDPC